MIKQKMFHVLAIASIMFGSALMLGAGPVTSGVYPGTIFAFGGATCPAGSVYADGSSVLRAGKYAILYAAIGTAWGTADGTHFNLPKTQGAFLRGYGAGFDPDSASRTAVATGGNTGNNVGSYQADGFASHQHVEVANTSVGQTSVADSSILGIGNGGAQVPGPTGFNTAATGGNETRPDNVYVVYCVKY